MLTQKRLKELLHYEPQTGTFTWLVKRNSHSGSVKPGSIAGCQVQRYIIIGIDGERLLAHRLAFLYMRGRWPIKYIDHIDGDGSNNRFKNLRDVSHSINLQNRHSATILNKTGLLGVVPNHRRFSAQIKIDGKQVYLGTFDTAKKAHAVYLQRKRKAHPGCSI